jgi:uncharacterized protein
MPMSKVLIVSDSHGLTTELSKIKVLHQDEVAAFIHCGDSELPANSPELEGYLVVRGNCDMEVEFPESLVHQMDGKKILVTHGHLYSVKQSLMKLTYLALEQKAQIVCFGHSHILGAELINGILFINPGSIRLPRLRKEKTYCILDLKDDKMVLSVYDINSGLLPHLSHEFEVLS